MGQESFSFSAADVRREAAGRRSRGGGGAREDRSDAEAKSARKAAAPAKAAEPAAPTDRDEPAPEPAALTVSQLTAEIEGRLRSLGSLRVEGEISGLRQASSGHVYFDLKEDGALVSCVVWRSQVKRAIGTKLEEGMQVLVRGRLDVYAPHGRYKLIVDKVEPLGLGALLARLEELKAELSALGRFDRARPLPTLPKNIGVVTSRDGAALRDFLRTRSKRWPLYPVRLRHALVQGPGSAEDVARGIRELDASGVDLIVITRGGGSLQDLWSFNERVVADAIWETSVPVVSAVGHETDTSLSDFVADHRAHTPTDAAQTVIPDRSELLERMVRAQGRLSEAVDAMLVRREDRLDLLARTRVLRDPRVLLTDRATRLDEVRARLALSAGRLVERRAARLGDLRLALERNAPGQRLAALEARLDGARRGLENAAARVLDEGERRIQLAARSLDAISPLAVLGRGYSITTREDGRALRDAAEAEVGERVETRLSRGRIVARVEEVEPADDDGAEAP